MTKSSPLRLITCCYEGRYCKVGLLIDTTPKYPQQSNRSVKGVRRTRDLSQQHLRHSITLEVGGEDGFYGTQVLSQRVVLMRSKSLRLEPEQSYL